MFKKIIGFALAAPLVSCSGNEKANEAEVKKDTPAAEPVTHPENELAEFKFTTLVINVPSPFEIIADLSKSKIPFNAALPNPPMASSGRISSRPPSTFLASNTRLSG